MCADFVVGETTHGFLAQILVLRRVRDDQRTSSVFRSQLLAPRSSPYHSSTDQQRPQCNVYFHVCIDDKTINVPTFLFLYIFIDLCVLPGVVVFLHLK